VPKLHHIIPVSDARRDGLRPADEYAETLLEKAGLVGANILCLFIVVLVDFEELAFALS
jgi:hypothetical protein